MLRFPLGCDEEDPDVLLIVIMGIGDSHPAGCLELLES
jgi:hypothetical protein